LKIKNFELLFLLLLFILFQTKEKERTTFPFISDQLTCDGIYLQMPSIHYLNICGIKHITTNHWFKDIPLMSTFANYVNHKLLDRENTYKVDKLFFTRRYCLRYQRLVLSSDNQFLRTYFYNIPHNIKYHRYIGR